MKGFLHKKRTAFFLALCACLVFSGCAIGGIRENYESLPQIDPEDGITRDIPVTLYYRLTDEGYLAGIARSIPVRANERIEKAMVRTLLEGVPLQALSSNVSSLFPENTGILDASVSGDIFYITLSREFMSTAAYDKARATALTSYQNGFISEEAYLAMLDAAQDELLLNRRLAAYSIVNTVTQYNPSLRVQISVDMDGIGTGARLKLQDIGLDGTGQQNNGVIEPLSFDESFAVTPKIIAQCAFSRMVRGEYELAYPLFAEDDGSGVQKPQYANFETEMHSLGKLKSFALSNYTLDGDESYARLKADLTFEVHGAHKEYKGVQLLLKREGDLFKLGYGTLLNLITKG